MIYGKYLTSSELLGASYNDIFNLHSEPSCIDQGLLLEASLKMRFMILDSKGDWRNFNTAHAHWKILQTVPWMCQDLLPPEPVPSDYPIV